MTSDWAKLTVYFGESDRVGRRLLSDVLLGLFEEHAAHAAVLLRATEGFGMTQTLRTDRFLTLSEDLPLVAVAVDERRRLEPLVPAVAGLLAGGLVTLERVRPLERGDGASLRAAGPPAELKLTLYLGRDERVGIRPAYLEVVDRLHRHGVAGATVLLGVDGMAHRLRRRARFFSRNDAVPLAVVSIGSAEAIARALPLVDEILAEPIATLERAPVCKRDGRLVAAPEPAAEGSWQQLTVYAGEQARHRGRPLHLALVRRLREEGAGGATCVRGIWGFSGDHPPHGDTLLRVGRRVPIVTTIVDAPERAARWFRVVDEVTDEAGLVTSENVPAFLAVGRGRRLGTLAG